MRRLGPHFQEAVDKLVARLKEQGVGETAPKPGEPMPLFVLPDETGHLVSLDTLLDKGPVAITFHRGYWCPYCRINHTCARQGARRIAAEGGQIAAIMPDQQHHRQCSRPIRTRLSRSSPTSDNGCTCSFTLAFWVGDEMQELMTGAGWDVSRSQGSNTWLLPIPATFVVAPTVR